MAMRFVSSAARLFRPTVAVCLVPMMVLGVGAVSYERGTPVTPMRGRRVCHPKCVCVNPRVSQVCLFMVMQFVSNGPGIFGALRLIRRPNRIYYTMISFSYLLCHVWQVCLFMLMRFVCSAHPPRNPLEA